MFTKYLDPTKQERLQFLPRYYKTTTIKESDLMKKVGVEVKAFSRNIKLFSFFFE